MVSYGAMDPVFTDRLQFPHVYRMVLNENYQYQAVVQLLRHFGWNWVGILSGEDDSSQRGSQNLKNLITSSGGCVEFLYTLSEDTKTGKQFANNIQKSTNKVVIVNMDMENMSFAISQYFQKGIERVWILLSNLIGSDINQEAKIFPEEGNGSLTLVIHKEDIPGLREFMHNVTPYGHKEDKLLQTVWADLFDCFPVVDNISGVMRTAEPCSGNETLESIPLHFFDTVNFRIVFSIYTAVYIVAHSLHEMLSDTSSGIRMDPSNQERPLQPWKVFSIALNHLKSLTYLTSILHNTYRKDLHR